MIENINEILEKATETEIVSSNIFLRYSAQWQRLALLPITQAH